MILFRVVLFLFFTLILRTNVYSVPAYIKKVSLKIEYGSCVSLTLKGDEYCKWAVSEDGYTLVPGDSIGWFYARTDSNGFAVRSSFKLCAREFRSDDLLSFLEKQQKGIVSSNNRIRKSKINLRSLSSFKRTPIVGNRRCLVVLMSFSDLKFSKSISDFDALFNDKDYRVDGAQGSVYDYFVENSYGQLELHSDVVGPYTAKHNRAYYGSNSGYGGVDVNPYELFLEAIEAANKDVDFRDYDMDNDGYVDNVHIIFAGHGEEAGASAEAIWSHEASFPELSIDGMKIDRYSCTPELRGNSGTGISRIGPCCHEIGHALGAMDYYDTDYTQGGSYEGTGEWDVMASGSWNNDGITPPHFNPYVKAYDFGWSQVVKLQDNGEYTLAPSTTQNEVVYRLDTQDDGDFYLIENRIRTNFDSFLPGEGLMIYHVHPDININAQKNMINASAPQMMYPVCASSNVSLPTKLPSSYGNINSEGCPFPGSIQKTSFNQNTTPKAFSWSGNDVFFDINNIAFLPNNNISFYYLNENSEQEFDWGVVWHEDFENTESAVSWRVQDDIKPNVQWNCRMVKDNDWSQIASWDVMSEAAGGKSYMCKVQSLLFSSDTSCLQSPFTFSCKTGNEKLKFSYAIRSRYGDEASVELVLVDAKTGQHDILVVLKDEMKNWDDCLISLPQKLNEQYLMVKGITNRLTGIYIDEISVIEPNENIGSMIRLPIDKSVEILQMSGFVSIKLSHPSNISIYNSLGERVYISNRKLYHYNLVLPSGFYIVQTDSVRKKILVRDIP